MSEKILSRFCFSALAAFPVSDHFDGSKFYNPNGNHEKTIWSLIKWWSEPKQDWPDRVELPARPPLERQVPADEIHITFINHATFLIRSSEWSLLTDPHFTERASPFSFIGPKRVHEPAYSLEQIPKVNYVLISHNHYDHMDLGSLKQIQKAFAPKVIVPLGNKTFLEKEASLPDVAEMDWYQTAHFGDLAITCVPAQHWSARGLFDRYDMLWSGFLIQWKGRQIFFAGDTGYGPHFGEIQKRYGDMDLALLPIGAYEPRWFMKGHHMNPEEAVQAHLDLEAVKSIGMHFGTFRLTNEGISEPAKALGDARKKYGIGEQIFTAPAVGETIVLKIQ